MKVIDTLSFHHLIRNGIGSVLVHTAKKLKGINGSIENIEFGQQLVGKRFTHIILDRDDFNKLCLDETVTIAYLKTLIKHFRPVE